MFKCKFCEKIFISIGNCRKHEKVFHDFVFSKYICSTCGFKCSLKVELNEHIVLDHASNDSLPVKLPKKILCPVCDKRFSTMANCKRHQKNIHGCCLFKCSKCEFLCSNKDELSQHTIVNHVEKPNPLPVQTQTTYTCPYCSETFRKFLTLIKHKKMHHNFSTRVQCSECKKSFSSYKTCKSHENRFHKKYSINFPCAECKIAFSSKKNLYQHIRDNHPNLMKTEEKLNFNTWQDFEQWKEKIEDGTLSSYIRTAHKGSTTVFSCHRSGYFKTKSKGIRLIKSGGTVKINSYCPASITVKKCKESGVLSVDYFPTHLGHKCDMRYIRLCHSEKAKIADQLLSGISTSYILYEIAETSLPNERLSVTNAQDIRNIARKYKINGNTIRNENDILSVESWVLEMVQLDKNPILLYKFPGKMNSDLPDLNKDDFILGFMNEAQEEILKLYGNEVIYIDSTHGTNKYNIQLTSLIIRDDNLEGFPVAFLWSNRQHQSVFTYFFQKMKVRIGDLKTNSFMSDDYKALFNAWCDVFSKPNFYLLCNKHVKRAFKKKLTTGLTKVKNEKVDEVLNWLFELIDETDETTFITLLDVFKGIVINDPDTHKFGCYFIENYFNRTKQWAACYRMDAKKNTDMKIERWHKDLKYDSDFKGKCGGRLDKAIHSLLKNLRLVLFIRLTSLRKGNLTQKLCLIRETHKIAIEIKDQLQIYKQSENSWIITSATEIGATYKIKIKSIDLNHRCNLACNFCNVCLHKISCTCPNYEIKYNMCEHIHAFCLKENLFCDSQQISQDFYNVDAIKEKQSILIEKPQHESLKELKSLLKNLVSEIDKYSEDQCKEMIKSITLGKDKCKAIIPAENSSKSHPLVASTSSSLKKIKPC